MPQPAAEEKETAADTATGNRARVCNRLGNFLTRSGRQRFIRIQNKDPLILKRKMLQCPILLFRPNAVELKLHHLRAVPLRDSNRTIGALRIDPQKILPPPPHTP